MNGHHDNKKLKRKSFLMRSQERSDYKLEPAKALDVFAAAVSLLFAVLVWLYV